jgi:glycogen operon protein
MLLSGDEIGRTQQGNNNAYCQDNEISWLDWEHADEPLLEFTRGLISFRLRHRVFRRRSYFQGRPIHGTDVSDIAWFTPAGDEMDEGNWDEGYAKAVTVFLNGEALERGRRGEEHIDDSFLVLFNAHHEHMTFTLPDSKWGDAWVVVIDTRDWTIEADASPIKTGESLEVEARSVVVLCRDAAVNGGSGHRSS